MPLNTIKSLDTLFAEQGHDPFAEFEQQFRHQQYYDQQFRDITQQYAEEEFKSIIGSQLADLDVDKPIVIDGQGDNNIQFSKPDVNAFDATSTDLSDSLFPLGIVNPEPEIKPNAVPKPKNRKVIRKLGKSALVVTASIAAVGGGTRFIDHVIDMSSGGKAESSSLEIDNNVPAGGFLEAVPQTAIKIDNTVSEQPTTSTTTTPETTVPPRAATLIETVANGERRLEDIAGNKVGTLKIEGICLSDIDVSVANSADPVAHPEILDGFDWSLLNKNPELTPVESGDYEAARERLNPLYKLALNANPQQACEMPGVSEYAPRWSRHTSGSNDAVNTYRTPGELTPQAGIHPYSVLPGQYGVTYIEGHRTTESAPFLNLDALVPGQTAEFTDGYNIYTYQFIGFETVNPDINISEILAKTIDNKNTLIVSTCDEGGSVRLMALFVQQ